MGWLTGWSYRKSITIPAAKVTGTLTDYPLLVDMTDAGLVGKALANRADVRFTSSDGTTLIPYHLIRRIGASSQPVACWTWFNRPMAIYSSANTATWIGYVNVDGNQAIMEWDHTTHTRTDTVVSTSTTEKDDHNNPALFERSDGKILACWGKHNGAGLYYAISTNAGDSTAWDATQTLTPDAGGTYTYAQLCYLSSEGASGRLYWFYRNLSATHQWRYMYSDDQGSTWSASAAFIQDSTYPYIEAVSNGDDRIDVVVSRHPNNDSRYVYHLYYDGAWKQSDGTSAGTAPYDYADATLIHDASAGTDDVWVSDIAIDGSGNPHVLYYVYPSGTATNQDLYYGKWTGSAWSTAKVMDEGGGINPTDEVYYPGVARFDPDDVTTIYASKEESSVYEIQKWTTADAGSTWSKAVDLTAGSSSPNGRPIIADGHGAKTDVSVWWWSGAYTTFESFAAQLHSWPHYNVNGNPHLDYARTKVGSVGGSDATIYLYYGNTAAADAQSRTNTWAGVTGLQCVHHFFGDGTGTKTATDDSGGSLPATINNTGGDWDTSSYNLPGFYLNKNSVAGNGISVASVDMAGEDEVTGLVVASWQTIDANEQLLLGNWTTTSAGLMLRIEPADNSLEAFVRREADTQEGGKVGTFSVTQGTLHQFVVEFDHDAASNADIIVRQNKTEATYSCSSSAVLDADASGAYNLGYAAVGSADRHKGVVAVHLLAYSLLTKNWTDTHYDNCTDAEFVTWGSEEAVAEPSGFKPYWLRRSTQIIGGGVA
jgi:hypothetical protein